MNLHVFHRDLRTFQNMAEYTFVTDSHADLLQGYAGREVGFIRGSELQQVIFPGGRGHC